MSISYATEFEFKNESDFNDAKQKTLKKSVAFSGIGLFSGKNATLTILPAEENTGIVFQLVDVPGKPHIKADLDHVVSTPRCTILGNKQYTIHTVEHVLAALSGLGIDNAFLKLSGPEVPIMDGSAEPFVEAILEAGVISQEKSRSIHSLKTPVYFSSGDVHIIAIPFPGFKISYTMHYPESELLKSQYISLVINPETFTKEIAPCRTFCVYEEILPFIESGLIKGGGPDNAVIIKNDVVVNPDGVRFSDEMCRHKVLDMIGDLSLVPQHFHAHVIAIRSGHSSNVAFGHELLNRLQIEKAQNGKVYV